MCLVAEAQLYCSALLCFSCFDARTILLWTPTNSCSLSSVYYQIWDYAESPTNPQTFLNPNLHDLFDLMFEILLACVFRTLSVSFETKQFWGLPKYNYALGWSCKNYILLGLFFLIAFAPPVRGVHCTSMQSDMLSSRLQWQQEVGEHIIQAVYLLCGQGLMIITESTYYMLF